MRSRFFLLFLLAATSGCSPSVFFGPDEDPTVLEVPNHRSSHLACREIRLGDRQMDVRIVRRFVGCLNANGAFESLDRLVQSLSDSELRPWVRLGNEWFLSDRERFLKLQAVVFDLDEKELLQKGFRLFAEYLLEEEFIEASLEVWQESLSKSPAEMTRGMATVGRVLDNERFAELFSWLLVISGDPLVKKLLQRFEGSGHPGTSLEELVEKTSTRLLAEEGYSVGGEWVTMIEDGTWFEFVDAVSRNGGLSQLLALLKTLLEKRENEQVLLSGVASLFQTLSSPISCFRGTHQVSSVMEKVFQEFFLVPSLRDFIFQSVPTDTVLVSLFCDIPGEEVQKHFPAIFQLGETEALEYTVELIRRLRGIRHPDGVDLASDLIRFVRSSEEFIPILVEFQRRDVWSDLLPIFAHLSEDFRFDLQGFVRESKAQGLTKDLGRSFLLASAKAKANYLRSLQNMIRRKISFFPSFFETSLQIYASSDAHPLLDLMRELMVSESKNQFLSDIISSMARMDRFPEALETIGDMARSGQLRRFLIEAFSWLSSSQGSRSFVGQPVSIPQKKWISSEAATVSSIPFAEVDLSHLEACRQIDVGKTLQQIESDPVMIQHFVNCFSREYGLNLDNMVSDLKATRFDGGVGLLGLVTQSIDSLYRVQDAPGAERFASAWFESMKDGRYLDTLGLFGRFFPAEPEQSAVMSFLNASVGVNQNQAIELLPGYVSQFIFSFEGAVEEESSSSQKQGGSFFSDDVRNTLLGALEAVECVEDPLERQNRAESALKDYSFGLSNVQKVDGHLRRFQLSSVRRQQFQPLIDGLNQATFRKGLRDFFVDLNVADLAKWIQRWSSDQEVLWLYDVSSSRLEVRLASTMDRFEILLNEASWSLPNRESFAVHYLKRIAFSWGDEDRLIWPDFVRAQYPLPLNPPSLSQTLDEIEAELRVYEETMGHPSFPDCVSAGVPRKEGMAGSLAPEAVRARLYNMRQVFSVLRENQVDGDHPHSGGLRVARGFLAKILEASGEIQREEPLSSDYLFSQTSVEGFRNFRSLVDSGWEDWLVDSRMASFYDRSNLGFLSAAASVGLLKQLSHEVKTIEDVEEWLESIRTVLASSEWEPLMVQLQSRQAFHELAGIVIEDDRWLKRMLKVISLFSHFESASVDSALLLFRDLVLPWGEGSRALLMRALETGDSLSVAEPGYEILSELLMDPSSRSLLLLLKEIYADDLSRASFELGTQLMLEAIRDPGLRGGRALETLREMTTYLSMGASDPNARRVRTFLDQVYRETAPQVLEIVRDDPDRFYRLMRAFSVWVGSERFRGFVDRANRFIQ